MRMISAKELVKEMKVGWKNHPGEAPEYRIETTWMDREQELVGQWLGGRTSGIVRYD